MSRQDLISACRSALTFIEQNHPGRVGAFVKLQLRDALQKAGAYVPPSEPTPEEVNKVLEKLRERIDKEWIFTTETPNIHLSWDECQALLCALKAKKPPDGKRVYEAEKLLRLCVISPLTPGIQMSTEDRQISQRITNLINAVRQDDAEIARAHRGCPCDPGCDVEMEIAAAILQREERDM